MHIPKTSVGEKTTALHSERRLTPEPSHGDRSHMRIISAMTPAVEAALAAAEALPKQWEVSSHCIRRGS